MDHFSIDDVRGYFLEDMRSFFQRIDESARAIGGSERITRKLQLADKRGRSYFELVAAAAGDLERAPGVHGSATGAVPAALCGLAEFGVQRADGVLSGVDELRRMAEECSVSVIELQQILDATLQKDEARTAELFTAFLKRFSSWSETVEVGMTVGRRVSTDDEVPPAPPKQFADAPAEGSVPFRGILNRIEDASKRILEQSKAFELESPAPPVEVTLFEIIQDCAHSVCGSCALLGLEPLSDAARLLERFACGARVAAERVLLGAQAMRDAARLAQSAAAALVRAHQANDAASKARIVGAIVARIAEHTNPHAQAEAVPAALPSTATEASLPSEAPEFDFGDAAEPVPASTDADASEPIQFGFDSVIASEPEAAGSLVGADEAAASEGQLDVELLQFFREEAQQAVIPLQGYLATLRRDRKRLDVVGNLEKLFHTLKGSSATVGLQQVTAMSAALEDRMELALEGLRAGTVRIDDAFVDDLMRATNELLVAGGLPKLSVAEAMPQARDDAGDFSDLRRIFVQEADGICSEVEVELRAARELVAGSADWKRHVVAVGRMFHKLKGSAVLNDAQRLADVAAVGQDVFEADVPLGDCIERGQAALSEIRAELEQVRQQIGDVESQISARGSQASAATGSVLTGSVAQGALEVEYEILREPVEIETDAVWEAFEIESAETLEAMDRDVLALEDSDQPKEWVRKLFRAYHTLKGAANTVGLNPLGRTLHRVEDFLDELTRAAVLPPLRNVSRFLLKLQESVRENLRQARHGFLETCPKRVEAEIEAILSGRAPLSSSAANSRVSQTSSATRSTAGKSQHSAASGTKSVGSAGAATRSRERKYVRVPAERLEALMNLTGEIVIDRARLLRRVATLRQLQRDLVSNRSRLISTVDAFREQYEFSGIGAKARHISHARATELVGAGAQSSGVLVPHKGGGGGHGRGSELEQVFSDIELDRYEDINILSRVLSEVTSDISEVQNQVNSVLDLLNEDSDHFSTNVADLQTEIMRARMVPLDQLFIRLHRPLRDAAERERKDARLVTFGDDVTLDKTIIDELYTPLLHLVRNSVSHGIESSDVRRRRSKDVEGVVTLRARQESGQIVLEVHDDGGGLDLPAIHKRGVEMGLITADTPVDSVAVRNLIFATGLSVRTTANDVAGRGVGCDVVKREIERLNGQIQVETEKGVGTTFTITLPTTLAIYRALVVEHAGQKFAMALNFSEMILDLQEAQVVESAGVQRVKFRDAFVTLKSLGELLGLSPDASSAPSTSNIAVVLKMGENRLAVRVDRIVGQEEIVVKSMGDLLHDHPMFSGVTIGGDGRLILIADVPGLIQGHRRDDFGARAGSSNRATASVEDVGEREVEPQRRTVRVLYVDDSLSVRKAAEKLLKNLGVEVTLAVDGADGLEKLRQGKFDLVFTDLEMPRLNGYDMVRELRYVPAFKDVPVVVVTSRSGEKHRQQATAVGATDYVTKPFNQEVLGEKLARWANYDPFGDQA